MKIKKSLILLLLCRIFIGSMSVYKNRVADKILEDNLEAAGLVLIERTKWCGKTTTYKR